MKEYFSHDFNARNDTKLIKVFMKHGVAGIGIYWCIIEMLYEESGYLDVSEYERISFELRVNIETIKSIIEDFNLFENDNEKFWSESALDRIQQRMDKSEKARASVMKRWNKKKRNTNVKQSNNDSNTSKVKESKVKKDISPLKFYKSELEISENNKRYDNFIKFLFGANTLDRELSGVLSIKEQITFKQFEKLIGKSDPKTIATKVLQMENDSKYWKGKTSFYMTLNNWLMDRFKK